MTRVLVPVAAGVAVALAHVLGGSDFGRGVAVGVVVGVVLGYAYVASRLRAYVREVGAGWQKDVSPPPAGSRPTGLPPKPVPAAMPLAVPVPYLHRG
jgi:hypothetical protein